MRTRLERRSSETKPYAMGQDSRRRWRDGMRLCVAPAFVSDPRAIEAGPPRQGRSRLFVSRRPMPRTHSIPLCDVSWTCACPRPPEQQLHPFPSLTPAHTPARVSRSNRGVDAPTGSDSGSLARPRGLAAGAVAGTIIDKQCASSPLYVMRARDLVRAHARRPRS